MQDASNGQRPPAALERDAQGETAPAARAEPFHPGTRVFVRQWLEDHRWLSVPLARLGGILRLPGRWPDRPACAVLRWLDASLPIFLGTLLGGLLLNHVEPFGLDNAAKARSQQVSARMMAPFYRSDAQDNIAVVLINEETLRSRGIGWPPQYAFYDELLGRILAHRPRAVYVDVFLEELRDYDASYPRALDALRATLEAQGDARAPVFFGVSAPGRSSVFAGAGVRHVAAGWQGAGNAYPLSIDEDSEFSLGQSLGADDGVDRRSVALALYQAACPDARAGCAQPAGALSKRALGVPMSVHWGSTLPVLPQPWPALHCTERAPPSAPARWAKAAGLMLDSLFSGMRDGIEDRKREPCPYALTVFEDEVEADALLDGPSGKALLQDRVVLVGTHLLGLNDRVLTPVHQQVPGVYLHAMALDNLMTWGEQRIHATPGLGKALGWATSLLMSLACGGVLVLVRRPRWLRSLLVIVAPVLVGLAMMVVAQVWLRQPPQDWIGMALLAVLVGLYVKRWVDKAESEGGKADEWTAERNGAPAGAGAGVVDGDGDAGFVGGGLASGPDGAGAADGGAGTPSASGL